MKVLVVGDVHGRTRWKEMIKETSFDKLIFLGDYLDPRDMITDKEALNNFYDIINYKRKHIDKVILLIGNHDIFYIRNLYDNIKYKKIFTQHKDLFQIAYQYKNHLFTHAGVTKQWFNKYSSYFMNIDDNIAKRLNDIYQTNPQVLLTVGNARRYDRNEDNVGGPLWADMSESETDLIDNHIQYVGHTHIKHYVCIKNNNNSEIHYLDNAEFTTGQHVFEL
jgi:predicted phosphodiesterase